MPPDEGGGLRQTNGLADLDGGTAVGVDEGIDEPALPDVAAAPRDQAIADAARFAVITAPEVRPEATVDRLRGIIDGL